MNLDPVTRVRAATVALVVDGNVDAVGEFFATDYVIHLTGSDAAGGHAVIRNACALYQRAFSDLQVEIEVLVAAKDRVAWQRTVRATHTGSFRGFPGTGRPIIWRDMVTSRFRDGLIVEEWLVSDLAEQLLHGRKG